MKRAAPRPLLLGLVLFVALALPTPCVTADEEPAEKDRAHGPHRVLGLDRVDPFLASSVDAEHLALLAGAGELMVRTTPIAWERIEPHAPLMEGRQLHDWEALDAFVAAWTQAGFEVVLVLSPGAGWATVDLEETAWVRQVRERLTGAEAEVMVREGTGARPPRAEHWSQWERFVHDVAERYDGDGREDAKGLARPVHWLQIVDQPTSARRWTGSAEEYTRLLHLARAGATKASGAVRIAHGAVDVRTLGHAPWPDDTELTERLVRARRDLPAAAVFEERRALEFLQLTLTFRQLFSAVAHAGSGHLVDEEVDVTYVRGLLDRASRPDLEVWLVDSPSAKLDRTSRQGRDRLTLEEERTRARGRAMAGATTQDWYERGQAYDVVRTACVSRAAGASRVFLGGDPETGSLDTFLSEGTRQPAWYALRQLSNRTQGHERVTATHAGRGASVFSFTFPSQAGRPWVRVVFHDPDRSWAGHPEEGETPADVVLRLPDGSYVVEYVALEDGTARRRKVSVRGGTLKLPLGAAPVYVFPDS